jgi:serine/threonine-protein kinase
MGRVFLGQELSSGRVVVIKVMHPHVAGNPRFRQSFRREMLLMKRFHHPHAVELYDASTEEADTPCIIMEYVPGITLEALLRRLDPNRLGRLLGQICNVLHTAHTVGIIHRDLTPANIMSMQPDTPTEQIKVMDFGLARLGSVPYIPLEKLTGAKGPLAGGTPDYVCPEQIRGEEVDGRGDLYSLGVLLFKALTGFLPFEQVTETADILWAHLHTPPPRFADQVMAAARPKSHRSLSWRAGSARAYQWVRVVVPSITGFLHAHASRAGLCRRALGQPGNPQAVTAQPEKGRHIGHDQRFEEVESRGRADAPPP